MQLRLAGPNDLTVVSRIMAAAIEQLQAAFLTQEQIEASRAVMGLDTQLVADRTYFVVEEDEDVIGCGGWSRRATLYGGDHSVEPRAPRLLDPEAEAARVRAMYTRPDHARKGVGRLLLSASEEAARAEGFRAIELMATRSGELLYSSSGYHAVEQEDVWIGGISVPLVRMRKDLSGLR